MGRSYGARKIHQIDPHTGTILRTIESNRLVTGVTWGDGELWHGTWGGRSELRHIDERTGEVLERLELPPGASVSGLELDGRDQLFCGGGRSGKIRTVRRPKQGQSGAETYVGEPMAVVRISKGKFDPARSTGAEQLLIDSERALRDALTKLPGLLHYYVGIDRPHGSLTNVSVWDSVENAHHMDTLPEMLAQRPILEAAGVSFEVITNHETLWTITP